MLSKPVAIALLAGTCVAAAGGGAFLAVRQNTAEAPASAAPAVPAAAQPLVHETEAVVEPQPLIPVEPEPVEAAPVPRRTPSPAPAPDRAAPMTARAPAAVSPAPQPVARDAAPARTAPPAAEAVPPRTELPSAPAESRPAEPVRAESPLPPARFYEDLTVPASSVIGLQIDSAVSSERARLEDRVEARVLRDVLVDGRTAIPAGSRAVGAVTLVERGGKMTERARLGVRFHTIVLADSMQVPVRTDTIFREGESPTGDSARKIGGAAAGGAILGAIIGGKKGAVIGGATGAAGGTAVVFAGDRNAATLPAGAVVTVRLAEPLTVEVERR
jgi:type IV secretory pathway VirB10-like protein